MKTIKLSTRIALGFITVTLLTILLGVVSMLNINNVHNNGEYIGTTLLPSVRYIGNIKTDVLDLRRYTFRCALSKTKEENTPLVKKLESIEEAFKADVAEYTKYLDTPEEKQLWDNFIVKFKEYQTIQANINAAAVDGKFDLMKKLLDESRTLYETSLANLDKIVVYNNNQATEIVALSKSEYDRGFNFMMVVLFVIILLSITISITISRIISKKLTSVQLAAQKLAIGDLGIELDNSSQDEIGLLINDFKKLIDTNKLIIENAKRISEGDLTVTLYKRSDNDELMIALSLMVQRLNEIASQIIDAAANVATASNQFGSTTAQIAQGAYEQASSAEEISSSVEEMNSTIQQNTENAISTEKIASNSSININEVASSAQKSLDAIRQISEKIKIINTIAEKTDILAINAAIEAARAGEHGKGFAVVAAEVRKLAETSQRAAVEINSLSTTSLRITEDAGKLMMDIIPDIQKTAALVKEISVSSFEQATGAAQIANAIEQLSQVTQQNSAAAEEMSSTAEELASQAEVLNEIIGFFNTGKAISKTINTTRGSYGLKDKKNVDSKQSKDNSLNMNDHYYEKF